MKFELNRLPPGASDEEIKNEIKRVTELIPDTVISMKKFDELSKITSNTLRRKFGSWENALKLCGLEHRYTSQRRYSDDEFINELKRVSQQVGKLELTQAEFNENSEIDGTSVARRFGKWSNALKLAGLEVGHKFYTDLECFENILNVWTYYSRQPKRREMDIPPSKITSGAYRRFGKWSLALQAFIDYINSDSPNVEQPQIEVQIIEEKKVITTEERRDISLGLRYKVLSRDRFKCVKCGNSPSTDINCKLHINHILPFSKGGLTTFENLQTLCSNCNLGKGNRHNE